MRANERRLALAGALAALLAGCGAGPQPAPLTRADAPEVVAPRPASRALLGDPAGEPAIGDVVKVLRVVVDLDAPPTDPLLWDANDNESIEIGDAVKMLRWITGLDDWPGLPPGEAAVTVY